MMIINLLSILNYFTARIFIIEPYLLVRYELKSRAFLPKKRDFSTVRNKVKVGLV